VIKIKDQVTSNISLLNNQAIMPGGDDDDLIDDELLDS
jgi:hypothetical protein